MSCGGLCPGLNDIIRFCSAPCVAKIDEAGYRARVEEACAFLRGERGQGLVQDTYQRRPVLTHPHGQVGKQAGGSGDPQLRQAELA